MYDFHFDVKKVFFVLSKLITSVLTSGRAFIHFDVIAYFVIKVKFNVTENVKYARLVAPYSYK